jgi:DNA-binding transcriptional LysR family regulator
LICFHEPSNPIQLDLNKFDCHEIGKEIIRPYISNEILSTLEIPGTPEAPVPLLMYSPAVYFARVVETVIENASQKLYGYRAFEAGMTDVLGDLAEQGLGIAWLPSRSFHGEKLKNLIPVGNGMWDITVSLIAYRAKFNARPAVSNIWDQIVKTKI